MKCREWLCTIFILGISSPVLFAQLTVASGTMWHSAPDTPVKLSIAGDINVNTSTTNFSKAILELTGSSQTVTVSPGDSLNFQSMILTLTDPATVNLKGSWEVNQQLILNSGIITSSGAHLLYSGAAEVQGSDVSFVNGPFFAKGTGTLDFPIGLSGSTHDGYYPAKISKVANASSELGLTVVDQAANFTLTEQISVVFDDYHYLLSGDITKAGDPSQVRISLTRPTESSFIDPAKGSIPVVVEGNAVGDAALSAGGQELLSNLISSTAIPTARILTVGLSSDIQLMIYDLITPWTPDGVNDKLRIANIEATTSNTVTLLDRWGQVAKRWTNFVNYDASGTTPNQDNFDFTRLAPDSYICVVEYSISSTAAGITTSVSKKIAQMVTVLKVN